MDTAKELEGIEPMNILSACWRIVRVVLAFAAFLAALTYATITVLIKWLGG